MLLDITGINKAQLLAGLWNACRDTENPMYKQLTDELGPMTLKTAEGLLSSSVCFDIIDGKKCPVDFSRGHSFDDEEYDLINGAGAARRVIISIRKGEI